ncbi:MAG: Glycosyltransferase [Candidatus Magasanikbacteria bacterium GW2011_GWA2_45_39]|uniref:Glycosyltransferase n=1 Tax=Candidatus Magasanikbacteria bacterium GW2011_GWA2_45_39 TaxID=1619041 RepID=A0A0G1MDR4_9BACT|nr:MAG: Glycosyltransferase [Candidatus Magasanikbacteria bacterium GW2011_GWA2_45_39]HBW73808.1 hypothetical protein [Candidatus Magasanikbacteria bacterium]
MRVLIAADIFPPESGGPATYAVQLANGLVAQCIEVVIVSLNSDPDRSVLDKKVKLFRVVTRFKLFRYAHFMVLLFWHAWKSDKIYAMGPVNAGLPAWIIARLLNKKFVVKVVGDYAWEQGQVRGLVKDSVDEFQEKKYTGKIGRLKKIEREVVRNADCVIVPSKYLAAIVKGWGVSSEKIKVIYNAVKFQAVDPVKKPSDERWIVSVGRLVPWKGMQGLIEIMPEILEKHPNTRLKIIGDGPEMENLKSKIKDLHMETVVQLHGNLSRTETLAHIHAADLFVLNSGYEGLSHVILEALGFNVPVLASASGGNDEIIISGKTGELFQYSDKGVILKQIIHFLGSGITNNPWSQLDRGEFFKRFEPSTMIEETKKTLESV